MLAGGLGALLAGCSGSTGASPSSRSGGSVAGAPVLERYGAGDRQRGEWTFPRGTGSRLPVVMLVHGGFWQPAYGPDLERAVARAAAGLGLAVWNVDYRAADVDYPATFLDAAAALDHLPASRYVDRLDLDRLAVVGHSAGGHLALWLAGRAALPPGAPGVPTDRSPRVRLAVGQAPVADLVAAAEQQLGGGAVEALLDTTPGADPARYGVSSPQALLPVPTAGRPRLLLVHGTQDRVVPLAQSRGYLAAAQRTATPVTLREVTGAGHFDHLDPTSTALAPVWAELRRL
ncbi:MAG: alpha/beta hydrolase [Sporichthyaceae bacterium]